MQEEQKKTLNNESGLNNVDVNTDQDYISAINELKAKSVSKEQYDKLREENKKLLKSLTSGGYSNPENKPAEEKKDLNVLKKELFTKDHSNLEYCRLALEFRNECIKQGKPDPFVPNGSRVSATNDDIAAADRVAEALEACIEYADGDSNVFTNELQRIMVDVPIPRKRK